jgi:phage baseplate assembly protein W
MPICFLRLGRGGGRVKDLQLTGGDLLASGRGFATVTGADYVRQRVACALSEPYGSDPFNPAWGSALTGWLGAPQNSGTQAMVASEAQRVLSVLMAAQQLTLKSAVMTNTRSQLNSADVISAVSSVTAAAGTRPDAVQVTVTLTTMGGTQVQASRTVSA